VTETVYQSFPTVFRNNINLAVQPPPKYTKTLFYDRQSRYEISVSRWLPR